MQRNTWLAEIDMLKKCLRGIDGHIIFGYTIPRIGNLYKRDEGSKRFYNSKAWRRLAAIQIKREPLCAECLKVGRITPAQIADHIYPIREGGQKYDLDNLQSLCRACHNRKHK